MYVTNLTDGPLGINNKIVLKPKEENRYVPDTGDFYTKLSRLCNANLIEINNKPGMIKTIIADAVSVIDTKVENSVDAEDKVDVTTVADSEDSTDTIVSTTKVTSKKSGAKKRGTTTESSETK